MDREKQFEQFLEECKNRNEWCGQGNPNAHILIIGKEPYKKKLIPDPEIIRQLLQEQYDLCRSKKYGIADRKDNPTWINYQKLIEKVFKEKKFNPKVFDFEKYVFTTELNTIFRPKAELDEETRNNINKRLLFFKDSAFIKSFPVVILTCNNFISNNEKKGFLINDTFGVEYDIDPNLEGKPKGEYKDNYKSGHWFYTHHGDNGKKLVIHTRQLSRLYDYVFLDDMAKIIRAHLANIGLIDTSDF